MAESKRLTAHRASATIAAKADGIEIPNPEDEDEDDQGEEGTTTSKPEKDQEMSENTDTKAAIDAARAEGAKAERDRTTAVFASEHYAGREAIAAKMLGKDLSAEDVIDLLAASPLPATAGDSDEGDAAARANMRENLAANQPPGTSDDGGDQEESEADESLVANMKARFAASN